MVLTKDLHGAALPAPVLYPGSVERTAFAERDETKGYLMLRLGDGAVRWRFRPLPARPMVTATVYGRSVAQLARELRAIIDQSPTDAVLQIRVDGAANAAALPSASQLRRMAPETMNVAMSARSRAAQRDRHRPLTSQTTA